MTDPSKPLDLIPPGTRALLAIAGERYLATVIKTGEDWVQLTFPSTDYPVEGMYVVLELHDDDGYTTLESEVLEAPKEHGDPLVLRLPEAIQRNRHRSSWRVPTELPAKLKDHVHPRVRDVDLIDMSAAGLRIRTDADLAIGDNVDVTFALPGSGEHKVLCATAHVQRSEGDAENAQVGLKLISPDPTTLQAMKHYIRGRAREIHGAKKR